MLLQFGIKILHLYITNLEESDLTGCLVRTLQVYITSLHTTSWDQIQATMKKIQYSEEILYNRVSAGSIVEPQRDRTSSCDATFPELDHVIS